HLASSLSNLGALLQARGESAQAVPPLRDALTMQQVLLKRFADVSAEAEALNYAAQLPLTRDGFLSITQGHADAAHYDLLWQSKATRTRLFERRHRDLLASRDPEAVDLGRQVQQ